MNATEMKVRQNPADRKFYVVAPCGGGRWMPITSGFDTPQGARDSIPRLRGAERSQRTELTGV